MTSLPPCVEAGEAMLQAAAGGSPNLSCKRSTSILNITLMVGENHISPALFDLFKGSLITEVYF